MTAKRASVNQIVQIGVESTAGTTPGGGASEILEFFNWVVGMEADVKTFRPTGHKNTTVVEENMEWTSVAVDGPMDFRGICYPASSNFGIVSPALVSPSSTVYKWQFAPPITGISNPQTYYLQQGDANYCHSLNYLLFHDFGYTLTRKDWNFTGKCIGRNINNSATLTGGATTSGLAPAVPKTVSVYLDATSGALGSTKLLDTLQVDFNSTGVFGPYWTLNAANASYASHVDMAPKVGGKLLMEADTVGLALLGYLQQGVTYYLRVQSVGNTIDVPNSLSAQITHDLAIKVSKPNPFKDSEGIFAVEWDFEVVEDATWGHSHLFTVQNLLQAL
jgi:hypothetical protein